jgi:hypothetical protein
VSVSAADGCYGSAYHLERSIGERIRIGPTRLGDRRRLYAEPYTVTIGLGWLICDDIVLDNSVLVAVDSRVYPQADEMLMRCPKNPGTDNGTIRTLLAEVDWCS